MMFSGKVISGWKVSEGSEWTLIGKKSPQLPQMFYPVEDKELTIKKGDIIAARCTMVSPDTNKPGYGIVLFGGIRWPVFHLIFTRLYDLMLYSN